MSKPRRTFLKQGGLAGLAAFLPVSRSKAAAPLQQIADCPLIPTETAGPFPLDLSDSAFFFRQDVREDRDGVQLNLRIRVLGTDNCLPMEGVRVHIWHCDKLGRYSGYDVPTNPGQDGLTYLRGYQITDANGEVELITIFPGWYPGRVCHIHFQVNVSSAYAAISQLTFDHAAKQALYTAHAGIYTEGVDPKAPDTDGVFADGYSYQLANLTPNTATGGYSSFLELSVQGSGTTTGLTEVQLARQFALGQNMPNPHRGHTAIPLLLHQSGALTLRLFDLQGREVHHKAYGVFASGEHRLELDLEALGLPVQPYAYQVELVNAEGRFVDSKLMSTAR